MRNQLMSLFLGVAASVLVVACTEEAPPEETVSCSCSCTAVDPVDHCVNTQSCESTADCPTGTVCAELPSGLSGQVFPETVGSDPLASCGSSAPAKRCQLPAGSPGRQSLNTGFEVPSFRLIRIESSGFAAFTWNPPEETHIVHCALFSCPPVITESVHDGRPSFRIKNYEQCVMAAELFEPGEGVFDLGDSTIAFPPEPTAQSCGTASPRAVHQLSVGCWAYDKSKIIAATPLEPVNPSETFNFHDRFDLDCSSGVDGRTCSLSAGTLGICAQGACHPPCVTRLDCSGWEAPAQDAGTSDAGDAATTEPADLVCFKNGGYVGVCLPSDTTKTEVSQ